MSVFTRVPHAYLRITFAPFEPSTFLLPAAFPANHCPTPPRPPPQRKRLTIGVLVVAVHLRCTSPSRRRWRRQRRQQRRQRRQECRLRLSSHWPPPPPPGSCVIRPHLRGWHLSRIWTTTATLSMTSTRTAAASSNVNKEQRLPPSIDDWLLCCPLCCLLPDPSSTTFVIVQSSTLSPPAAVPYRQPSSAAVLSLARDAQDNIVVIL